MSDLLSHVRRALEGHPAAQPQGRVLCALSGGADSVVMTHALRALSTRQGFLVRAAHFSHGIRPEAADGERQLCQRLCDGLGIELVLGQGDVPAAAAQKGRGIEETARALRYAFLREQADGWGGAAIATAHNLEDQAETVLMNLVRGTGAAGLRGIEPMGERLVRPLLTVSRADIEAYARHHGLAYATDQSNFDDRYTRNRVRNQIMPLLREINPRAAEHMAAAARRAVLDDACISALCREAQLFHRQGERAVFDAARLAAAHPALAGRAVLAAFPAAAQGQLTARHVQAVLELAGADSPSGRVSLPGGVAAWRQYGDLYLGFEDVAAPTDRPPVAAMPGQRVTWGGFFVAVSEQILPDAWYFDRERMTFPVQIRQRRQGDTLAMGDYHKSVKKLMIEGKIPKNLRDNVPIICDNSGVLCVGSLMADRTRCVKTPQAGQTVSIQVSRAT